MVLWVQWLCLPLGFLNGAVRATSAPCMGFLHGHVPPPTEYQALVATLHTTPIPELQNSWCTRHESGNTLTVPDGHSVPSTHLYWTHQVLISSSVYSTRGMGSPLQGRAAAVMNHFRGNCITYPFPLPPPPPPPPPHTQTKWDTRINIHLHCTSNYIQWFYIRANLAEH